MVLLLLLILFVIHPMRRSLIGHTAAVNDLAFFPDNTKLVSAGADKMAVVWDVLTGKRLAALQGHTQAVTAIAVSRDSTIVTGSADGGVCTWRGDDGALGQRSSKLSGHYDEVAAVAVSHDGVYFASGGLDRTVIVWSMFHLVRLHAIDVASKVCSVAFAPHTNALAAGFKAIELINPATGATLHKARSHKGRVYGLQFWVPWPGQSSTDTLPRESKEPSTAE